MRKFISLAIMAFLSFSVQAQIVSSRSSMATRQILNEPGWSILGLEYLPSTTIQAINSGTWKEGHAFAISYTQAVAMTKSMPLFLEWGLGAQYSSYGNERVGNALDFLSVKAPLNIVLDIHISDTKIHLDPYVGLCVRGNAWGRTFYITKDYSSNNEEKFSDPISFFDNTGYKLFQIGGHFGVKARFESGFFVGVEHGSDFNTFINDDKKIISGVSVSGGLVF